MSSYDELIIMDWFLYLHNSQNIKVSQRLKQYLDY